MNGLHLSPAMKTLDNVFANIGIGIYTLGNLGTSKGALTTITSFTTTSTTTVATTTSRRAAATTMSR